MKTVTLLKMAVSSLIVVAGASSLGASATAGKSVSASQRSQMAKSAAGYAAQAKKLISKHKAEKAVVMAERAVASMPQDAGYRLLLGESYLAAGRFQSAETALKDALSLNPGSEQIALKLALAQTALGKTVDALAVLDSHRSALMPADYGLAVALAGDPHAAVRALEPAARGVGANAKIRQNLALAYALSGRWMEARAVAAQDLPADQVDKRIIEWAAFSRPTAAWDQVASLLGVTPARDSGQPVALALVETVAPVLAVVSPEPVAAPAPVVAEATPEPSIFTAEPAPTFEVAAVPTIRSSPLPVKQVIVPASTKFASEKAYKPVESGKFVVQLGAFSTMARAEAAWAKANRKMAGIGNYDASQSRVKVKAGSLYRIAVTGFASRQDAGRVCTQVRATGGVCFIRTIASDETIRWAARKSVETKLASR